MIIRPHGETNITTACQNSCASCNHFIPMQDPSFIKPEILEMDLNALSGFLHFSRYNLVGGEPTLHPKIIDLLQIVKDSGITDTMEITSNGQSVRRLPESFWGMIDEFIVTPYKLTNEDIGYIDRKCKEHGTAIQWHPVIFTAAAYKRRSNKPEADYRYKTCWYNVNRHVIDNGYFYRCCTAPFIPSVLMGLSKEHDGIAIEGLTEERLDEYLLQDETPESCFVCASNCGPVIDWHETDREHWIDESLR